MKSVGLLIYFAIIGLVHLPVSVETFVIRNGIYANSKQSTSHKDKSQVVWCMNNAEKWIAEASTHVCQRITIDGDKEYFTEHELKLRTIYRQLVTPNQKVFSHLVGHCFWYHKFDWNYAPCKGISHERPKVPKTGREKTIEALWQDLVKKFPNNAPKDKSHAMVRECLHTTEWLTNHTHQCHEIAYGGGLKANFSEHDKQLQTLYKKEKMTSQVFDCFYFHRTDEYIMCKDITFKDDGKEKDLLYTPRIKIYRDIWLKLVKRERCKLFKIDC